MQGIIRWLAYLQAAKQVADKLLPKPVSWADMFAISGAVRCPIPLQCLPAMH